MDRRFGMGVVSYISSLCDVILCCCPLLVGSNDPYDINGTLHTLNPSPHRQYYYLYPVLTSTRLPKVATVLT